MNKTLSLWGGIALATLVLMLLLNPSADRHRDTIRETVNGRSPFEQALGVGHLKAFMASYESLGVVSWTKAGDEVVSVGLLGMVFVVD